MWVIGLLVMEATMAAMVPMVAGEEADGVEVDGEEVDGAVDGAMDGAVEAGEVVAGEATITTVVGVAGAAGVAGKATKHSLS